MIYRELLIGCGHARDKRLRAPSRQDDSWANLTTLDSNPDVKPDLLCNLENTPWDVGPIGPASFPDCCFDEIHAYEVLEHLGQQGNARAFFRHFSEIYRLLKPNGFLCATVPSRNSPWALGDPSHTRIISLESLTFLSQAEYTRQLDGETKTAMSDFRHIYKDDLMLYAHHDDGNTFSFILQAVKPSRISK